MLCVSLCSAQLLSFTESSMIHCHFSPTKCFRLESLMVKMSLCCKLTFVDFAAPHACCSTFSWSAETWTVNSGAYSPRRRSQRLVISTSTARQQTFALKTSIRVYRKRSLGGRKAGLCVCFRGFWHFVINVESICFHKPVSGVSVSPFLVCLSNVHVVARLRRL